MWCYLSYLLLTCLLSFPDFQSGEHHRNTTMYLSSCHPPAFFFISCSAGKPCCNIRHSIKTSVGWNHSTSNYLFPCFWWLFWYMKSGAAIPNSFSPFTPLLFSLYFPSLASFFQPSLFPHQIPSLHNYHLLILNESPNTLHGFNTAC